jgi:hypothetical protein
MRLNFTRSFESSGKVSGAELAPGPAERHKEKFEVPMLALRDLMRPIGDHNALQPACPICSRPLRLTRITPRDGDLAELRTYGCTGCGVWLTEAAQD